MNRRQAERLALIVAVAGLVGAVIGWMVDPDAFPHAWLAALVAFIGWPLGCMGLLLVHALTGGRWGEAIRPQLIAGMNTLWLLLPALVLLAPVLPELYPWLQRDEGEPLHNRFYLNAPFLSLRAVIYLVGWFGLAWIINRALRQPNSTAGLARIAPGGLTVLAITVTFTAIDSTMSLDPHFASSVYGLIEIAEMGLFALSISVLAAALRPALQEDAVETLGELMMGLVILWAYLDFVQFLIAWESDLPSEAAWYLPRTTGGWGIAAAAVAICHFVLPFFALLSTRIRRSARGIAAVAGLLILGSVIRSWWLVVPASGRSLSPVDVMTMLGVLGLAAAVALRTPAQPQVPQRDAVSGHV